MIARRSVRAILLDAEGRLVLIKRTKPDQPPYWTTPGGGVESDDADLESALRRELGEELGATVDGCQQVFLYSSKAETGVSVQHFFVCSVGSVDPTARTGPEFEDPRRGGYDVDFVNLSGESLAWIDLKPTALRDFVQDNREAILDLAGVATP